MSDIDTQNKELGADGFFVGEYEKYAWSNIMDRKIGTHDKLYLYSEGLDLLNYVLNPEGGSIARL